MVANKSLGLSPSLVLAIGVHSLKIAVDVEEIMLRGDSRSSVLQNFLGLTSSNETCKLQPMQKMNDVAQEKNTLDQQIISNLSGLKAELGAALHSLQTHENLMQAGRGREAHIPLNVYILADFTLVAAGGFFPILLLANSLVIEFPYVQGHLLLNLASFEEGKEQFIAEACSYENLLQLESWLDGQETAWLQELAQALELDIPTISVWQPYLFDRYKEGLWEAKNDAEIQTIMGNFLLACLSSDLSTFLRQGVNQIERSEQKTYYSSAAASVLLYDPQILIRACAYRLGAELLSSVLGVDIAANPNSIESQVERIITQLGSVREWVTNLLAGTPFNLDSESTLSIGHILAGPDFEDLPVQEWACAISGHHEHFLENQMPGYLDEVKSNALKMDLNLQSLLPQLIRELPEHSVLYPGGIQASRRVIDALINDFLTRANRFEQALALLPDDAELAADLEQCLRQLEDAVSALPALPRWITRLPLVLKRWVQAIFNALTLRKEYQHLLALREDSLQMQVRFYKGALARESFSQLGQIAGLLCDPTDEILAGLDRLSSFVASVQLHFEKEALRITEDTSSFRLSVLDQGVFEWAYTRWKQPLEAMRVVLLEQALFFLDWQDADDLKLAKRLLDFGLEVFQPVWQLSLNEILVQHEHLDTKSLADLLSQGMLPLLRLNFDHLGAGCSSQANYFLSADIKQSTLFADLEQSELNWQCLVIDNKYFVLCCQIRQMIPLGALKLLLKRGENTLKKLTAELGDKKRGEII